MAILIDPPLWPAHDTLWSHLVSDRDLDELHAFARRLGVPRRGFDLDHYDVSASLHGRAVSLGAEPVDAHTLFRRLRASGLRIRSRDRPAARPAQRRTYLREQWSALREGIAPDGHDAGIDTGSWRALGDELLARWNEPHRRYHAETHLEDVLLSLDQLAVAGESVAAEALLAAWFHDAVYAGTPGADERASAELAAQRLVAAGLAPGVADRVRALVLATDPAAPPASGGPALAQLLDADLAILAAGETRYRSYAAAVRAEYAHVADADFRSARSRILRGFLARDAIYRTPIAQGLWEARARTNLAAEISALEQR